MWPCVRSLICIPACALPVLSGAQPHKRPQDLDVVVYRETPKNLQTVLSGQPMTTSARTAEDLNETVIPASPKLGNKKIARVQASASSR